MEIDEQQGTTMRRNRAIRRNGRTVYHNRKRWALRTPDSKIELVLMNTMQEYFSTGQKLM